MKNINLQYRELLEGKMNQAQFLRNARMMFPNFVTNQNSFNDSVTILKTKGMITEGDAVKGTPDKAPEYASPSLDAKTKYKKVEQSPEVDEQDGIYPATTLTDIPKAKASKKVKNTSDGLEPIKNNDTKNEMKKVKVVKEGIHDKNITSAPHTNVKTPPKGVGNYDPKERAANLSKLANFGPKKDIKEYNSYDDEPGYSDRPRRTPNRNWDTDDDVEDRYSDYEEDDSEDLDENNKSFDKIFADFIESDDTTELRTYIKEKGKEAVAKIKSKLPGLYDKARQKVAKLLKVELDEIRMTTEAKTQTPADTLSVTTLLKRVPMLDQKLNLINNAAEIQDIFDYILDRVNPSLESSVTQLRTALNLAIQSNIDNKKAKKQAGAPPVPSSNNIKDKLKPAITKLVQEVLDEMGTKE